MLLLSYACTSIYIYTDFHIGTNVFDWIPDVRTILTKYIMRIYLVPRDERRCTAGEINAVGLE